MRRRVLLSSTLGNALEWFDFTVFGLFSGLLAKLFFPADGAGALLSVFATFGVAFLARPIGGLLFGLYADRRGRKAALVTMIGLMAASTGLIGLLPTYAEIGIAAPLSLLACRIAQGVSAGGEFGGASALLIEFAPPGRRGYFGAFQMVAQALAFAAGAGLSAALAAGLSPESLSSWGWRVPFLLGVAVGPVGLYLRARCDESPAFLQASAVAPARAEILRELFCDYPRQIAASFGVIAAGAAITYVSFIFIPVYASTRLGLPLLDAQLGLLVVSLATAALIPVCGALSDRIGRRAVIAFGLIGFAAFFAFSLGRLVASPSVGAMWLVQASGLLFAVYAAPVPALMTEVFPPRVRATGASLAFNVAGALFGGLAPLINQWLIEATGRGDAPAFYILFAVALGLAALVNRRALSGALAP